MSIAVGDVKILLYGKNISAASPADFLHFLSGIKSEIQPAHFSNPIAGFVGGSSFVGRGKSFEAVLFSGDWLGLCVEAGASVRQAILCLAANHDEHQGIVTLALEMASITQKKNTVPEIRLSSEDLFNVFITIVGGNYAGIRDWLPKWGIEAKFDDPGMVEALTAKKARSDWRRKLGHDVLIHPVTLLPCADSDGTPLKYKGVVAESRGESEGGEQKCTCLFEFETAQGEAIQDSSFLPKKAT